MGAAASRRDSHPGPATGALESSLQAERGPAELAQDSRAGRRETDRPDGRPGPTRSARPGTRPDPGRSFGKVPELPAARADRPDLPGHGAPTWNASPGAAAARGDRPSLVTCLIRPGGPRSPGEALDLLCEPPIIRFRDLGAAAFVVGAAAFVVGAAVGRLLLLPPVQEVLAGRRIPQPEVLAVALQVQAQHVARDPAGDRLDAKELPAHQPEALERRIQVIAQRVEPEVLPHPEDIAIQGELLLIILAPGRLRRDLDDEIGGFALLPEQVVETLRLLGDADGHQDVGRDVLAAVTLLVEEQEVARDIDIGLVGVVVIQRRTALTISSRWRSVSAIGFPSEVG